MKICAVICEYNPFHSGHAHLISELKRRGYDVLCLMSGSFTQRGSAAVISKYSRAASAVKGGADLVLELPFPYCSLGAAGFAGGGVSLARSLGCVSALGFGCECGNAEKLMLAAKNALLPEFQAKLSDLGGERYAERVSAVYSEMLGDDAPSGSNDILAVEYLKAIISFGSEIAPVAVRRDGKDYNSGDIAGTVSATAARNAVLSGNIDPLRGLLPDDSYEALRKALTTGDIARDENLFLPYAAMFRTAKPADICGASCVNAELASRIVAASREAVSFCDMTARIKTKLYSDSAIRRALLFAFTGVGAHEITSPAFTTVLAANKTGREMLSAMEKTSSVPIITKPADYKMYGDGASRAFEASLRAESLWTLALDRPREAGYLMRRSPLMI